VAVTIFNSTNLKSFHHTNLLKSLSESIKPAGTGCHVRKKVVLLADKSQGYSIAPATHISKHFHTNSINILADISQ